MKVQRTHVMICAGTSCVSAGSMKFKEALEEELKKRGLEEEVKIATTGCNGFCAAGPIMIVHPGEIFYQKLLPENVERFVEEHVLKGRLVKELQYIEPETDKTIPRMKEIGFFSHQILIALKNRGLIDPEVIDEYIARDGYEGMVKALTEMTPEEIIEEMKKSGLRGRGGAGFPTGLKWQFCNQARGDVKYILCNADEGDPGAFMDRSILESDPHAVLEGMVIAAKAIGAHQGYIYVRAEYPLAIERLNVAIKQAKEYGLLGKDILGTGFDLEIDLYHGAGAFVCGEETALMRSIEGKRGTPRPRPPFPAHKGLWDRPSVLNNVETFANVPQIILRGAAWYSSLGTERSKGTKVFALAGDVQNIGLVEVPMGTKLSTIVNEIGGGMKSGKKLKAVQLGGPSGGCVPVSLLDTPVDYESIQETGAIMGSGGMVCMDESSCMVDIAKFFLTFTAEESCGKCVPCRIGTKVMLNILTDICEGRGKEGDIERLEDLAKNIAATSLCGLGQTAPNPVLTTLKYFRDEYEQHIKYKRCPAKRCKKIISSPCQYTCPVHIDVPSYVALIAEGKFAEAWSVIREANCLPGICGRVCNHPCEGSCTRKELDTPVSIKTLKRFTDDWFASHTDGPLLEKPERTKKETVAVIGAGPAGLSCANDLVRMGYGAVIYEALPVAGGMLAVGIPDYRLPKEVLQREIDVIKELGVEIKLDSPVGVKGGPSLDDLLEQYDAVFIGIGAHKGLKLKIPNEDVEGVMDCIELLRNVNLGEEVKLGKKVGIIGAGNAAVDAARTSLRLGCDEVSIIYRRTRAEMPALSEEIEEAGREGVKFYLLAAPVEVLVEKGKMKGLKCQRMKLGEPDASGRRRPVPIEDAYFELELDNLIPAISQEPDISFLGEDHSGLDISRWNSLVVDEDTLATNKPGIFAGGDGVTGPATVIEAMAAGKVAAQSIDRYIQGVDLERVYDVMKPYMTVEKIELTEEDEKLERPHQPCLTIADRLKGFSEVELGFDKETSMREARRCLRCDLTEE